MDNELWYENASTITVPITITVKEGPEKADDKLWYENAEFQPS